MARDYLIIHVSIWNEMDFKEFFNHVKNYDDEGLKIIMFPEGIISRIDILRPEEGDK